MSQKLTPEEVGRRKQAEYDALPQHIARFYDYRGTTNTDKPPTWEDFRPWWKRSRAAPLFTRIAYAWSMIRAIRKAK